MPTLDWTMIGVVVTVVLAILGAFSGLLWTIRRGDLGKIKSLEEAFKTLRSHSSQLAKLEEKGCSIEKLNKFLEDLHADLEKFKGEISKDKEQIAVSAKSIMYIEENLKRTNDIIEKLREDMMDVKVTINGFGRDYVTRKEQQYETQFRTMQSQSPTPPAPQDPGGKK